MKRILAKRRTLTPMRVAAVVVILALGACAHTSVPPRFVQPVIELPSVPRIDDVLPIIRETEVRTMTSPSQLWPVYTVRVDDVEFTVGVDDDHKITYIATSDRSFQLPDAVKLGDSLATALRAAPGQHVVAERGWGQYLRLPSGWLAFIDDGPNIGDLPPSKKARVSWFFMRR